MANKKKKKIEVDVSDFKNGENRIISCVDGNYIMAEMHKSDERLGYTNNILEAEFDFTRNEHLYNRVLSVESSTYITTSSELIELAKNTQNDIDKIVKIGGIVQYYVNKNDIIGRVIEVIDNNVNTEYKINYPSLPNGRSQRKFKENLELVTKNFLKQIDVEELITKAVLETYMFGNYVGYLKGDANGCIVDSFPLSLIEVSSYKIDGEPLVTLNVDDLKKIIQQSQSQYSRLKSVKIPIIKTLEEELRTNYPQEVYDAYTVKDKLCFLAPDRCSIVRVNNSQGLYGLTPIFKALSPQLMLETFDAVDEKNLLAKSKKIYHQILRAELLGKNFDNVKHPNEIGYAHGTLLTAMQKNTVIVTTPAYVEKIEIVEPKTIETNPETILGYRNRVLDALGIGFMSNQSKSSFNTVDVNVDELLKMINKIIRQVEKMINKFLKTMCVLNNIDVLYAPVLEILPTQIIDEESKSKLVDLLYSKIGASYKTVFNVLGKEFDYDTEIRNRINEQTYIVDGVEYNLDEVFTPHITSFTTSGDSEGDSNDGDSDGEPNDKTEENQNENKDKQKSDKKRYKNQK